MAGLSLCDERTEKTLEAIDKIHAAQLLLEFYGFLEDEFAGPDDFTKSYTLGGGGPRIYVNFITLKFFVRERKRTAVEHIHFEALLWCVYQGLFLHLEPRFTDEVLDGADRIHPLWEISGGCAPRISRERVKELRGPRISGALWRKAAQLSETHVRLEGEGWVDG